MLRTMLRFGNHLSLPTLTFLVTVIATGLVSCATTTKLDQIVLDYDGTVAESVSKLLLLNIARARQNKPMHFTAVSNIVATYKFTVGGGFLPAATGNFGWLPVPHIGGAVEENPTVSIAPMQGDEFTQRLLTPFQEEKLTLLLRQGYDVDALLRMLGGEVRLDGESAGTDTTSRNRPGDKLGYETYRHVMAHLSAIQDQHSLFVEPLYFNLSWSISADAVTPETFESTYKGFSTIYDAEKRSWRITKRVIGRVMISNYDLAELSNEERFALHAQAEEAPFNDVLLDIRAGHVGGKYPLHGRFRLRSFHEVLMFIGRGIGEEPESDVAPDARTPAISENPRSALEIIESRSPPNGQAMMVRLNGLYYAVGPQANYQWNEKAFALLNQLFQMSVANVTHSGPAITIAK